MCVWGTGEQTRDWVHIADIVRIIEWCISDSSKYFTLNIGTGIATPFKDLIEKIYTVVHQAPCSAIQSLTDKPQGVQHRLADVSLLQSLGILPKIDLEHGIRTML